MLKKIFFIITVLSIVLTSFGQAPKQGSLKNKRIKFHAVNSDMILRSKLNLENEMIAFRCDPYLNEFISDSLSARMKNPKYKDGFRNYEIASDSLHICIVDSYSWNVQNSLPKFRNKDVFKLYSKKESKYSKEENELYNYLLFYAGQDFMYIDKFVYYQNIAVGSKLFQFVYHVTYEDGNRNIILVEIVEK